MTYHERVVLTHHPEADDEVSLELLFAERNMSKLLPLDDMDYRISAETQMVYTTSPAAGAPNLVATRILCDKMADETPAVSDDIDVFQFMPHGTVVFVTTLDFESFRNQWPMMFRSKMPYEKLMARLPANTNYYDLYRECSTNGKCAHSILVKDFALHVPLYGMTLGQWSQADSCVLTACIIRKYAVDWYRYSNLAAMAK